MASKLQLLRGLAKYQLDSGDNAELIQGLEDVLQVECDEVQN
jgi:acyl carrier protein